MKKVVGLVAVGLMAFAVFAQADTASITVTVTNNQAITYSDAFLVSGYLDKIEVVQDAGAATTSTVTVATYDGTTAVETFASLSSLTGNKVVRYRAAPQTSAGVTVDVATNAIPYEKVIIGGNVKAAVTGTANDGSNPVKITIYYEPLKK